MPGAVMGAKKARKMQRRAARQTARDVRRYGGLGQKIHPLIGTPPFPAPEGMVWIVQKGKARLIIPGGKVAKRIISRRLREAGVFKPFDRPVALPAVDAAPPMAPLPIGPSGGVVGSGQGAPGYYPDDSYGYEDYAAPQYQFSTGPAPVNVPGDVFPRTQYGTPQTPMEYAEDYGDGEGYGEPYEDGTDGTLFPVSDTLEPEYDAEEAALDDLESSDIYSGPFNDGLSGVSDLFSGVLDYWRGKWDQAVAYFQARIGEFMGLKEKLMKADREFSLLIKKAERSASIDDATMQMIRNGAQANRDLLEKQGSLESDVAAAAKKIGLIKQADADSKASQLGVLPLIPIAIGAAAVAGIVTVTGAVVIHMGRVREHLAELDLLEKKVLTPAELAAVNASRGGGMFSDLFKGIGGTILLAGAAYLGYRYLSTRRAG